MTEDRSIPKFSDYELFTMKKRVTVKIAHINIKELASGLFWN
jgi:hypothetical protein